MSFEQAGLGALLHRNAWLGSHSWFLPDSLLCYIWHPHGTKPASRPGTWLPTFRSLLSTVRPRSDRPAYLWRLRCGHLPGLRLAAGISRRTRDRI